MAACKMLQHCYGVFQWKPMSNFSQHTAPEPRIGLWEQGRGPYPGKSEAGCLLIVVEWQTDAGWFSGALYFFKQD